MPIPSKDERIRQLTLAMQQADEVNRALFLRDQQSQRLVWQLVKQAGGKALIPAQPTPMLWKLQFKEGEHPGTLEIEAQELPPPTKNQLDDLANELRGTEKDLQLVLQHSVFKDYPPQAIEHALAKDHVIFTGTLWLDAEAARALRHPI